MKLELDPNQGCVLIQENDKGHFYLKVGTYFLKDYPEEKAEAMLQLLQGIVGIVEYAPEVVARMSDLAFPVEEDDIHFDPDPQLLKAIKEKQKDDNVIDFTKVWTSRRKH